MRQEHIRLLHCGPKQLLTVVRLKYWPLSRRREARKVTRSCISCFRCNLQACDALQANLQRARVHEFGKAFHTCGVDQAGPCLVRESKRRERIPTNKAWIAVFTCFTIRAVHLELITSLTSEAFVAALRRFTSRRNTPNDIYSDNGTNFVGANRELREIYDFLKNNEADITSRLALRRINQHFIPLLRHRFRFLIDLILVREVTLYALSRSTPYIVISVFGIFPFEKITKELPNLNESNKKYRRTNNKINRR